MYLKMFIFIFLPLFMYSNEKFKNINVGYYSGINTIPKYKNSKTALIMWIDGFTKNIDKDINMKIYNNRKDAINDYINFKINIIAISAHTYLLNKQKLDNNTVNYWQLKRSEVKPYQKMYLIVNRDSNINTILDLKNKKIGIDRKNIFGKIFLENTYLNSSKKNADEIISSINYSESSSLLLKTYFSKYDAAVVSSFEYEVMLELNPAIKKKIKILKSSPEIFPHVIMLFHKNNTTQHIELFKDTLYKFLRTGNKEELFDALKIKKFTINKKEDFDNLNEYYQNYLKLKSKFKK